MSPPAPALALALGRPWPLGASVEPGGVNIAVFSAHAERLWLCVYDAEGRHELGRALLPGHTDEVFHGFLPGAGEGLVYGLRAEGPWRPDRGHRFNPAKLLLDPYAREIVGRFDWSAPHFGHDPAHPLARDERDNGAVALKARVVAPLAGEGAAPSRPQVPWADTVIYEAHVKGLTMRHPGVPEALRGTYAGLASEPVIAHLKRLGVTTLSLLPVAQHLTEQRLAALGLRNYWGYNTLGFFAVEPSYARSDDPRAEFRAMVRTLHAAGLEVLLDVVYNHTPETDETGPTLSLRGLDHHSYYRHAGEPLHLVNDTGCGNTLNLAHPRVLQLVLDSLRHWASEFEVDGFRFDLAPVLGRGEHGFDPHAAFFQALQQDPLLGRLKLVAEPWDIGPGGYRLGQFPRGWREWNDRFRDGVRSFWLEGHEPGSTGAARGEFAQRLCGSSDLFQPRRRQPGESVNFIVAHDGFTLRDLLTYRHKRNEANGEHNRDGHHANHGWPCGVDGESDDPPVRARRAALARALLATLLLAQGTPMLAAGDELGHTQHGNNNAYCQDNDTSWIDWGGADAPLIAFVARCLALRRELRPLGEHWYTGLPDRSGLHDLAWVDAHGTPIAGDAWHDRSQRSLGALIGRPGRAPMPLLLLVNAGLDAVDFTLPAGRWQVLLDSHAADGRSDWQGEGHYPLAGLGLALLADGRDTAAIAQAQRGAALPLRRGAHPSHAVGSAPMPAPSPDAS